MEEIRKASFVVRRVYGGDGRREVLQEIKPDTLFGNADNIIPDRLNLLPNCPNLIFFILIFELHINNNKKILLEEREKKL